MTLPNERTRAVIYARDFLRSLLNPAETPRIPKSIRYKARSVLKHFPWEMHLDESAQALPDVWGPLSQDIKEKQVDGSDESVSIESVDAVTLREANQHISDLENEVEYWANLFKRASAQNEVYHYRQALELIAASKRADGTYNRSREACEVLARVALQAHQDPGKDSST